MTTDRTASVVAAIDAVCEWTPGEPGADAMSTVLSPMDAAIAWADVLTDLDDRGLTARYRMAEAHAPVWITARAPGDPVECLGCGWPDARVVWPCAEFKATAGREAGR